MHQVKIHTSPINGARRPHDHSLMGADGGAEACLTQAKVLQVAGVGFSHAGDPLVHVVQSLQQGVADPQAGILLDVAMSASLKKTGERPCSWMI